MVAKIKVCKDCQATSLALLRKPRPAPYPGPRCATHYREFRRKTKKATADKRAEKMYGITPDEYQALLVAQDGRCAWCRRKIGNTVRAAIDHDHSCEVCGGSGCRECVRGLLDRKCNEILGWFGDDPVTITRGARYLAYPPAAAVLRGIRPMDRDIELTYEASQKTLREEDLKVEYFHVKTDPVHQGPRGVSITHLPSGMVAEAWNGRSQLENKSRALQSLRLELEEQEEWT